MGLLAWYKTTGIRPVVQCKTKGQGPTSFYWVFAFKYSLFFTQDLPWYYNLFTYSLPLWHCLFITILPWNRFFLLRCSLFTQGLPWYSLFTQGLPWYSLFTQGLPWYSLFTQGLPWYSIFTQGLPWYSRFTQGLPWVWVSTYIVFMLERNKMEHFHEHSNMARVAGTVTGKVIVQNQISVKSVWVFLGS